MTSLAPLENQSMGVSQVPTFTFDNLVSSIREVGIRAGDIVYIHSGLDNLGLPSDLVNWRHAGSALLKAFIQVVTASGTIIVPTFSYSFCKNETYNPETSPSLLGGFANYLIKNRLGIRSLDPIFSMIGIGPRSSLLFSDLPKTCFGSDCLFERMGNANVKVCNIGVGLDFPTAVHYIECVGKVPYRFNKQFSGIVDNDGVQTIEDWTYCVRVNHSCSIHNGKSRIIEKSLLARGLANRVLIGNGEVNATCLRDMYFVGCQLLFGDPWCLAAGPPLSSDILSGLIGRESKTNQVPIDCAVI